MRNTEELKKRMIAFKVAWLDLLMQMEQVDDVKDYIVEDYPFDKSFNELKIIEWADSTIKKIDNKIMVEEEKLIKEMIDLYSSDKITWHEIQDIVEGRISTGDYKKDFEKENKILSIIDREIRKGDSKNEY